MNNISESLFDGTISYAAASKDKSTGNIKSRLISQIGDSVHIAAQAEKPSILFKSKFIQIKDHQNKDIWVNKKSLMSRVNTIDKTNIKGIKTIQDIEAKILEASKNVQVNFTITKQLNDFRAHNKILENRNKEIRNNVDFLTETLSDESRLSSIEWDKQNFSSHELERMEAKYNFKELLKMEDSFIFTRSAKLPNGNTLHPLEQNAIHFYTKTGDKLIRAIV